MEASQNAGEEGQIRLNDIVAGFNPWHRSREVPAAWVHASERGIARLLAKNLLGAALRRFYVIIGPRRVGKTTCMYQTAQHLLAAGVDPLKIWWLRLDHPGLVPFDLGELVRNVVRWSGATAESPAYVFLDEITYKRDWDLWLKTFYDETWPVRITASSSAAAALIKFRHESGVGRWMDLHLPPYSFSEYLELLGIPVEITPGETLHDTLTDVTTHVPRLPDIDVQLRRYLLTGGFPELLALRAVEDEESLFLRAQEHLGPDAIDQAIFKDIPQIFTIENPVLLKRLLCLLGGQIGGLVSMTNIAATLGAKVPTLDRYLSYLEDACLLFTTPNYSRSEGSVQKRGRKLYFVDGAVRSAALQRASVPLGNPEETGLLLENTVASHFYALAKQRHNRLYHWLHREKEVFEVDVVLDEPMGPLAVEVARGADHPRRGLIKFMERHPTAKGRCYLTSPDVGVLACGRSENGVGTIPLPLLLLSVGKQAEAVLRRRLA